MTAPRLMNKYMLGTLGTIGSIASIISFVVWIGGDDSRSRSLSQSSGDNSTNFQAAGDIAGDVSINVGPTPESIAQENQDSYFQTLEAIDQEVSAMAGEVESLHTTFQKGMKNEIRIVIDRLMDDAPLEIPEVFDSALKDPKFIAHARSIVAALRSIRLNLKWGKRYSELPETDPQSLELRLLAYQRFGEDLRKISVICQAEHKRLIGELEMDEFTEIIERNRYRTETEGE